MIYAGWYFCYQIKLSADETNNYLDMLFALQEENVSVEHRLRALKYLKNTELLLRGYAIPILTNCLIVAGKERHSSENAIKRNEYVSYLEKILTDLVPQNPTLSNIIKNLRTLEYGKLLELLKDEISKKSNEESLEIFSDYLETDLSTEVILLLSLLKAVAQKLPEQISGLVRGENQVFLIKDALDGKYGQLPWNLSIEILNLCQEPEYTLMSFFPQNWFTRPDLMELVCYIKYKRNDKRVIAQIFNETFKFIYLREYFHGSKDFSQNFWISGSGDNDDFTKSCAVMWQAVLWSYAMQIDSEQTIQELQKVWRLPDYIRNKNAVPFKMNYMQQKFPPAYAQIENQDMAQVYVQCPWIRHYAMKGSETKKKNFYKYGSFSYNGMALRIFTAIPIMKTILTNQSWENIFSDFICLIFHWGDVLSCEGAKDIFNNPNSIYDMSTDYAWSQPVRLLGYHVNKMLMQIGMGKVNSHVPTRLVDVLEQKADEMELQTEGEQMQYLFSSGAYIIAAHWANLSLAESWADELWANNAWFKDKEYSNAAELCRLIAQKDCSISKSMDVLLLIYEAFPRYLKPMPHDWLERYKSNGEPPVQSWDLIASEKLTYEEWADIKSIQRPGFQGDADKIALTFRLQTAFSAVQVTLDHLWLQQWMEKITELQQSSDFSLLVRFVMLKLLEITPAFHESYNSLYDVCKALIHAFNEFTTIDNIYYKTLLMKNLLTDTIKLGEESLDSLRMEMVDEMRTLIYQKGNGHLTDEQEIFCRLLNYFIIQTEITINRSNKQKRLNEFWESRTAKQTELRLRKIENIEQLKKLSCYMWQKGDDCIRIVEMAANTEKSKFTQLKALNLFEHKAKVCDDGLYVGIIVNKQYSKKVSAEDEVTCSINYGEGETIDYSAEKKKLKYYNVGQTVFIRLRDGKVESIMSGAFVPQEGEVVKGNYKISADKIDVVVFGEKFPGGSDEAFFNQWNADLSQIILSQNTDLEGECFVEWHKNNWVPVVRNFSQLILEQILDWDNPDYKITLILIGNQKVKERDSWLFSSNIGYNYRVYNENLDAKCLEELRKRIEAVDGAGLIVRMKLRKDCAGVPVLALDGEMPFDDKNIRWKERFAEEDMFVVTKEDDNWYIDSNVPEIADRIMVEVEGAKGDVRQRHLRKLNVQLKREWDIVGQRCARVEVEQVKSRKLSANMDYIQLQKILDMKAGDIFDLAYIRYAKAFRGYYNAYLSGGVAVKCAVESVSSQNYVEATHNLLYEKRACIIEYVESREKRNENASACTVKRLDIYNGPIRGIVAEIPDEISESQGREFVLGVCLELEDKVAYVNVPVSAFSQVPSLIGEPVQAERSAGGWIFQILPRNVYVRALWEIDNHKAEKNVKIYGIPLGFVDISGMGSGMAIQDEKAPVIHLLKSGSHFGGSDGISSEWISQLKEKISWWAYRKCNTRIFKNTFSTSIVKVLVNGKEIIGEARSECDFANTTDWRVVIEVNRVRMSEGGACYDLRRKFIPMYNVPETSLQNDMEQKREQVKQYLDWCKMEKYHAEGSVRKKRDGKVIQLHDLSIPVFADKISEYDQWTKEVPLKEEEPWILGRSYNENDVRVKLQVEGNMWMASYQSADVMLLDENSAIYFNAVYGKEVEQDLFYAGLDENDRMRFEWGFGYRLLAKVEDVTDEAGNLVAQELFFGDRILKFRLERDEGEYGWKMRVSMDGIFHELESKVVHDAQKDVIQLLEVHKNRDGKQVIVQQVSVAAREIGQTGWTLEKMKSAKLDKESIQRILEEESLEDDFYILAKLTLESQKRRNSMTFSYIPLSSQEEWDEELKNKVLCLVAGSIREIAPSRDGKVANNCKIEFFLPKELPPKLDEEDAGESSRNRIARKVSDIHMRVSVTRRKFSLDESKLRVLLNTDPDVYYKRNMMVRLTERHKNSISWDGNLVTIPPRTEKCLKEWVRVKKTCFVIMGNKMKDNTVQIEISPGILSTISQKNIYGELEKGALASLKRQDDDVYAEMILPGDISYMSENRPVELLIMDGALNSYFDLNKRNEQSKEFTVAGFPQLMIHDLKALDKEVSERPPHLAYLSKAGVALKILPEKVVHAGFLQIDKETLQPIIQKISPEPIQLQTSWNRISFRDGTISEIVSHVRRGRWHYHDKRTGILNREEKSLDVIVWPEKNGVKGCVYDSVPLFLAKGNILRYPQNELNKFGYSAREIQQNGLPTKNGWYPIAGATATDIWIEMLPGKLIDIPNKYLFAVEDGENLATMCTAIFGPGDEIKLSETEYSVNQLTKLLVTDVRFGLRSAFLRGDAYLPIKERLEDGIVLGGGNFTLTFPMADTEQWEVGEICRLDSANTLHKVDERCTPSIGDTVMLCYEGRRRIIKGLPDVCPILMNAYFWKGAEWLQTYLWDFKNVSNNIFKEGIPVQIRDIVKDDKGVKYRVVYPQSALGDMESGMVLYCNALGEIVQDGEKKAVLRTGGHLFCVRSDELIPGLWENARTYVIKALAEKKAAFWMHRAQDGWRSGLVPKEKNVDLKLDFLFPVQEARGILCRDETLLRLWWLPVNQACRAGAASVADVYEALSVEKGRVNNAVIMDDRTVSIIHTPNSNTRFITMNQKGMKQRIVPRVKMSNQKGAFYTYLGELFPHGDIVCLISEKELPYGKTEPIPIDVITKTDKEIRAIPSGMGRKKLNLSGWVIEALRSSYVHGKISYEIFASHKPQRYKEYDEAALLALEDAQKIELNITEAKSTIKNRIYEFQKVSEEKCLVYLYAFLEQPRLPKDLMNYTFGLVRKHLSSWLSKTGKAMASGFDRRYYQNKVEELDLFPTVSAILLLNWIRTNEEECKLLAVHLTRILGILCMSSMHQEFLLNNWLFQEVGGGMWLRLSSLYLGGESLDGRVEEQFDGMLCTNQYQRIANVCKSIISRKDRPQKLKLTAECLLYAAGLEVDYRDLYFSLTARNSDCICGRMAYLGRCLMPGFGRMTAMSKLHASINTILKDAFSKMAREDSYPVTLLTDNVFPITEEEKEWAVNLCMNVL